jgi:hypothetical protein
MKFRVGQRVRVRNMGAGVIDFILAGVPAIVAVRLDSGTQVSVNATDVEPE